MTAQVARKLAAVAQMAAAEEQLQRGRWLALNGDPLRAFQALDGAEVAIRQGRKQLREYVESIGLEAA